MTSCVITLATSKGGAGKSTLARNLAAHWINIGMKVAVIDADPQGSIINRHDPLGLLSKLTVVAEPEESVSEVIEEFRKEYNYIIVDTGGFRNRTTVRALVSTDIAIIPLKPSADDVAGALETYNLVKELNSDSCHVIDNLHELLCIYYYFILIQILTYIFHIFLLL